MNAHEESACCKKTLTPPTKRHVNRFWIYMKAYLQFLYEMSGKCGHVMKWTAYHYGFQMIILLGTYKAYTALNKTRADIAPHLKKGGNINN